MPEPKSSPQEQAAVARDADDASLEELEAAARILERERRDVLLALTTDRCFVVIKKGVYMHGVWGPWSRMAVAAEAAQRLAAADDDAYHSWDVHQLDADAAEGLGPQLASYTQWGTQVWYWCTDWLKELTRVWRMEQEPVRAAVHLRNGDVVQPAFAEPPLAELIRAGCAAARIAVGSSAADFKKSIDRVNAAVAREPLDVDP